MPTTEIDGKIYTSGKLYIKMPDTLDTDIKKSAMLFYRNQGLNEAQMSTNHRNYPIHIVMYFRVGHIGKTTEQQLAEDNEMNNFKRVLQLLINEDSFCRECVEIL